MSSAEYKALKKRFDELRRRFVSFTIPLTRNPRPSELDKIAAFKLLMHAEIETYIEDRVARALAESVNGWLTRRTANRCVLNLALRWSEGWNGQDGFDKIQSGTDIDELIKRYSKRAREELSQNNGIKQNAFSRIACTAGLIEDNLDRTLLLELENFGSTRGDVAHRGVGKVNSLNSPESEANSAKNIVNLLEQFDNDVAQLTGAAR